MKTILIILAAIIILIPIGFLGNYYSWWSYNYFAPKYATTQNKIFMHGTPYMRGKIRDLADYQSQYMEAKTKSERATLRATIIYEYKIFPISQLPPHLQRFYRMIKNRYYQK